jgi:hypothetical protein
MTRHDGPPGQGLEQPLGQNGQEGQDEYLEAAEQQEQAKMSSGTRSAANSRPEDQKGRQ